MSHDLVDRLRLVRSPGIGPVTYRQLIARFGSAAVALEAVSDLAARGGGKAPRLVSRGDAEREIARVETLGARYLVLGQGLYPRALAELDDAPPVLTVKGNLSLLDRPLIAIVGARNASAAACRFARQLAYDLGQQDAVVVEAAPRSGSLITARLAAEAGREVMAVPGSPLDPRAQGCNQLIRQGATLVQNATDVLEAVRPMQSSLASPRNAYEAEPYQSDGDDSALGIVEELLGPSPVPVDEIIRLSGVPSGAVQMALLELDLAGRLDRHAGGKVSLRAA